MATYRELTYMVLDKLKLISDDAYFTEDHVVFLLKQYRKYVLELEKQKNTLALTDDTYQTICLDLERALGLEGMACEGGTFLRSTSKVPVFSSVAAPRAYTENYFIGDIAFVNRDRMKYVGRNKWLKNIIYAAVGPDMYLYLRSANPQFLYITKLRITAVFDDPEEAADLSCCDCDSGDCDPMDATFPVEGYMIPTILELTYKELAGPAYQPEDKNNDANDNMSDYGSSAAKAAAQYAAYKRLRGKDNADD